MKMTRILPVSIMFFFLLSTLAFSQPLLNQTMTIEPPGIVPASATEYLMRHHAVLERILYIDDKIIEYYNQHAILAKGPLLSTIHLIQSFIQGYHEDLEEKHVYPVFRRQNKQTALVAELIDQHKQGRKLIGEILVQVKSGNPEDNRQVVEKLKAFIALYRPHMSREGTVLFPTFRSLLSDSEYEELGDKFEQQEEQLLGEGGFGNIVNQVAAIEKELGL